MHKSDMPKYWVRSYATDNTDGGCDDEVGCDTLKQAKAKAKYLLTEEYQRVIESFVPTHRVTVTKSDSDEVIVDLVNKKLKPHERT